MQRPNKLSRMELVELLLDEVPSRTIPDTLGMLALSKLLRLRSVATAMVTDVHSWTLQSYESRFMRLASAKYDVGVGLRAPNEQMLLGSGKQTQRPGLEA